MEGAVRGYHKDTSIRAAWLRLYICIITDNKDEFYMALCGHKAYKAEKGNYTWNEVNKTKPIRRGS